MTIKGILAKALAYFLVKKTRRWSTNPLNTQKKVFKNLIRKAKSTHFGLEHDFKNIKTFEDFSKKVPVRTYEEIQNYIELVMKGRKNILWPGKPLYFAKTSGTTSGIKYIPITKESMPTHINGSRDATLHYIHETGKTGFLNKKMIFLQGSPVLEEKNGIKTGRLSGIIAHHSPKYLKRNIMPSWETNCIEDWEAKVDQISAETLKEDMGVIGGIPPWVQMYFEKVKELSSKKTIEEVFPNFNLFVYGGVNYKPYKKTFDKLIGKKIDSIEYYPASEGFFAYQNTQKDKGLLLALNSGIYYEFIKLTDIQENSPKRYNVGNVKLGINYVLIVSTSSGLWAYDTGDTVMFVELNPHRVLVTGRAKHFISAFGEHVIGSEVEKALADALKSTNWIIKDFTVAPKIEDGKGLSCHEWWIEFDCKISNKEVHFLEQKIEQNLLSLNTYYRDLVEGKVLSRLKIISLKKGAFLRYMKSGGKLGGQNKLPRLSNNRIIVEQIKDEVI